MGGLVALDLLAPASPATADEVEDAARYVIEDRCGGCHRPDQDSAQEAAMAVFDLSRREWATGLSKEQLETFILRIEEDSSLDKADVEVVKRYLERSASP